MNGSIPERDWKYMRKVEADLLSMLCKRINKKSIAILSDTKKSEHDKYIKLYKHIQNSDNIIADCFNDWRRSNLSIKLANLQNYDLLTEEIIRNLSEETQQKLIHFREF